MGSVYVRGLQFTVHPGDHDPAHAHAGFDSGEVLVGFEKASVRLVEVRGIVSRPNVKRALKLAAEAYDALVAEWEKMHS